MNRSGAGAVSGGSSGLGTLLFLHQTNGICLDFSPKTIVLGLATDFNLKHKQVHLGGRSTKELEGERHASNTHHPLPLPLRRGFENTWLYRNASGHVDRTEKASAQIASHNYYGSARHLSGYEELAEGPGSGWKSVSPGNLTNLEGFFFVTLLGIFMQIHVKRKIWVNLSVSAWTEFWL